MKETKHFVPDPDKAYRPPRTLQDVFAREMATFSELHATQGFCGVMGGRTSAPPLCEIACFSNGLRGIQHPPVRCGLVRFTHPPFPCSRSKKISMFLPQGAIFVICLVYRVNRHELRTISTAMGEVLEGAQEGSFEAVGPSTPVRGMARSLTLGVPWVVNPGTPFSPPTQPARACWSRRYRGPYPPRLA